MSVQHTPEPWAVSLFTHRSILHGPSQGLKITSAEGISICAITRDYSDRALLVRKANADRIVECVNAMEGIDSPEKLRQSWEVLKKLELDAYYNLKEKFDKAIAALNEISSVHPKNHSEGRAGAYAAVRKIAIEALGEIEKEVEKEATS